MPLSHHVYRIRPQPELAPAILLRESYREDGNVRKRTLCNLSDWPKAHVEGLRGVLKGGTVISQRPRPHRHGKKWPCGMRE